jgi:hypothetical protein
VSGEGAKRVGGEGVKPTRRPATDRRPLYVAIAAIAVVAGLVFFSGRPASNAAPASAADAALPVDDEAAPERDLVFAYRVSHPHWGRELLEVGADGVVHYVLEAPGRDPVQAELTLSAEELEALSARTLEAHPCDLRSGRTEGGPNESQPSLEVALPEAQCTVTLFFDEWRELPDARALSQLVSELRVSLAQAE